MCIMPVACIGGSRNRHRMPSVRVGCRLGGQRVTRVRIGGRRMIGMPGMWIDLGRSVVHAMRGMRVGGLGRGVMVAGVCILRGGIAGRGGQRDAQQGTGHRLHASILTSRIIPASMWYSRWQWKAQRPAASARTR